MKEEAFIDLCFADENGINLYHRVIGQKNNKRYPFRLQYFLILHEEDPYFKTPPIDRYRKNENFKKDDLEDEFIFFSAVRHLCYLNLISLKYLFEAINSPALGSSRPDFTSKILFCAGITEQMDILGKATKLIEEKNKEKAVLISCKDKLSNNKPFIECIAKYYEADDEAYPKIRGFSSKDFRNLHAHRYQFWWWHRANNPFEWGFRESDLKDALEQKEEAFSDLFKDTKGWERCILVEAAPEDFISAREIMNAWYEHLMAKFKKILKNLGDDLPESGEFEKRFKKEDATEKR